MVQESGNITSMISNKKLLSIVAVFTIFLVGFVGHESFATPSANILFQDNYSSNAGWTKVGTTVTVNSPSFPGIVKWNNEHGEGGASDDRVYKQLPTALPADHWVAEFDYQFSESSLVRSWIFNLSSTPTDPWFDYTSPDIVTIEHGFGVDQLVVELGPRGASSSAGIPISPNTQYYVKLERVPNQLILSVFSDPARTVNVSGSPVTLSISAGDLNNLNFIQHAGCSACGPARTLTAEVDNTEIFTNSSSLFCGKPASFYDHVIIGTNGNETLSGTSGNDLIIGKGGNDIIYGNAGNDCLIGSAGDDKIYGGDGNDEIHAGDGNDYINAGDGDDKVYGGNGNDEIHAGDGNDYVNGNAGDDKIYGGNGDDILHGGDGNDYESGDGGNDQLFGEAGNDTLYGGIGDDHMNGDNGTDKCVGGPGINTKLNCES